MCIFFSFFLFFVEGLGPKTHNGDSLEETLLVPVRLSLKEENVGELVYGRGAASELAKTRVQSEPNALAGSHSYCCKKGGERG